MDILYSVLGVLVILLLIAVFITALLFSSPKIKGKFGEYRVRRVIGKGAAFQDRFHNTLGASKRETHVVFNDFMIKDGDHTAQIDHIVVNKKGVFVIETKNYAGSIYGTADQREWTQVLAYGRVKNKFYNPLKQNAVHIYRLKKFIGESVPVYSAVIFVKNNGGKIRSNEIIPLHNLKKYINDRFEDKLGYEQIAETAENIKNQKAAVTIGEHVENIKAQKEKIENNICPRCGGKLVLRKGTYSEFYGCENYPACSFIKHKREG